MIFEFATSQRILFGPGTLRQAAPLARELGSRALVVTSGDSSRAAALLSALDDQGLAHVIFPVTVEPTLATVRQGVVQATTSRCDLVIGFGGGSALDSAKAIAALTANGGDPLDHLEVIGRGLPLAKPSLPSVAIPTTAGTGSEVTRNAVLGSPEHGVKASLRGPTLLPRIAIVDPELTYALPPDITASTGLDALTQLIEPLTSIRANPLTDALCRAGIGRVARSLRRACTTGKDAAARADMAMASLFGGLALANAGLGAAHGLAGPVGGMFPAPHGAVCAALLPHVMNINIAALRARRPQSPVLARYAEVARLLTGSECAPPEEAAVWVLELIVELKIPRLGAYGLTSTHIPVLAERATAASSTKANPIPLTLDELSEILARAL